MKHRLTDSADGRLDTTAHGKAFKLLDVSEQLLSRTNFNLYSMRVRAQVSQMNDESLGRLEVV